MSRSNPSNVRQRPHSDEQIARLYERNHQFYLSMGFTYRLMRLLRLMSESSQKQQFNEMTKSTPQEVMEVILVEIAKALHLNQLEGLIFYMTVEGCLKWHFPDHLYRQDIGSFKNLTPHINKSESTRILEVGLLFTAIGIKCNLNDNNHFYSYVIKQLNNPHFDRIYTRWASEVKKYFQFTPRQVNLFYRKIEQQVSPKADRTYRDYNREVRERLVNSNSIQNIPMDDQPHHYSNYYNELANEKEPIPKIQEPDRSHLHFPRAGKVNPMTLATKTIFPTMAAPNYNHKKTAYSHYEQMSTIASPLPPPLKPLTKNSSIFSEADNEALVALQYRKGMSNISACNPLDEQHLMGWGMGGGGHSLRRNTSTTSNISIFSAIQTDTIQGGTAFLSTQRRDSLASNISVTPISVQGNPYPSIVAATNLGANMNPLPTIMPGVHIPENSERSEQSLDAEPN